MAVAHKNLALLAGCAISFYDNFFDMPENARKAFRQYCIEGVSDEEWDGHVSQFRYMLAEVPADRLKKAVFEDGKIQEPERFSAYSGFQDFFADEKQYRPEPTYQDERWPVFLSGWAAEPFEDGWNRFWHYTARGDETIPCIALLDAKMPYDEKQWRECVEELGREYNVI